MEKYTNEQAWDEAEKIKKRAQKIEGIQDKKEEPSAESLKKADREISEQEQLESESEINPEVKKDIEELFSLIKDFYAFRSDPKYSHEEAKKMAKKIREMQKTIRPFVKEIETPEEFFLEVEILDQKIKGMENKIGMPINLFEPAALSKLFESIIGLVNDNREEFLATFENDAKLDSRTIFFAIDRDIISNVDGSDLLLRWPAKVKGVNDIFCNRLIVRHFINELKKEGALLDEELEDTLMNVTPFARISENWRVTNEKITNEIRKKCHKKEKIYESICKRFDQDKYNKVRSELEDKLEVLNILRRPAEIFVGGNRNLMDVDLSLLNPEIEEIIQKYSRMRELDVLINHRFPYATGIANEL